MKAELRFRAIQAQTGFLSVVEEAALLMLILDQATGETEFTNIAFNKITDGVWTLFLNGSGVGRIVLSRSCQSGPLASAHPVRDSGDDDSFAETCHLCFFTACPSGSM